MVSPALEALPPETRPYLLAVSRTSLPLLWTAPVAPREPPDAVGLGHTADAGVGRRLRKAGE